MARPCFTPVPAPARCGLALLCIVALSAVVSACGADEPRRPNVVLIVMDTVRADRLSSYGYEKPTTPRLDAFAKTAVRYSNASSTSSWTLPAHASLFTGLGPIDHGATQEKIFLDERPATLAEILGAYGYTTLGVSGNVVVSRASGLARGFDGWIETWRETSQSPESSAHANVLAARRLLEEVPADSPWLLFVNYIEAHRPYSPPPELEARFVPASLRPEKVRRAASRHPASFYLDRASVDEAEIEAMRGLYDAGVAHVDALVGELLDSLEDAGRLDDALVIITSDHGENLGAHGHVDHVFSLYRSTTRIPLLIRLPDGRRGGELRDEPVSLVDVFATVLSQAGVTSPVDERRLGRDLLAGDFPESRSPIYSEYYFPSQALAAYSSEIRGRDASALQPYLRRLRALEQDQLRLIWSSDGLHELYDLGTDPEEARDRFGDPALVDRQQALLRTLRDRVAVSGGEPPRPASGAERPASKLGDLDDESRRQLEALGYLPASTPRDGP